jgi:hypothetical protein
MFGHILPLLIQVALQNDMHSENFRTSAAALAIYISAVVSMITQLYLASLEVKSRQRSTKFECGDDMQNAIDNTSIVFSITYSIIRICLPVGSYMDPTYVEEDHQVGALFFVMPIIHFLELMLTAGQAMFYLMLDKHRAKFIQLFWKSFVDIIPFLVIFALIILQTICLLHVLGASFDTGSNYELDDPLTDAVEGYDSNHNSY